jgi:hypothetical protein
VKSVAFARVLGKSRTRTPSGLPITISTPVFDDEQITPQEAIAKRAHETHGAVPHLPHWLVVSTYSVIDDVAATVKANARPAAQYCRAKFDRVYVLEFTADRQVRKDLKLDSIHLDPFDDHPSWYLRKEQTA